MRPYSVGYFLTMSAATAGLTGIAFGGGSLENPTSQPTISISPPIAPLPQALASFGAVVVDNWLYVLGGHIGEEHHHSRANLSDGFLRLNLFDRMSWEILPGGVGLQSVSLVSHNGMLYRSGGMHANNAPGETDDLQSVSDFSRFDPISREWQALPPLPEPRSSHDAVVYGDKIYVAGGWTLKGQSSTAQWLETAYEFDLSSSAGKWTELPQAPFKRRAVAVAAVRSKLYVMGGIDTERQPSTKVDVFDLNTRKWSVGPELPNDGFGISATTIEDNLYVSGVDGALNRLNAAGTGWERVTELSFPRFFHRLVTAGKNELLALGGAATRGEHLRQIESISIKDADPAPKITSWVLPYPGRAKNRQGIFFYNNMLYLFGGNNSTGQHDFELDNFLKESYQVSLGSLSIEKMPAFTAERQSMVTAIVNGPQAMGYAAGGFGFDREVARSKSDVFRYNFKESRWDLLGEKLPLSRTQFSMVAHGTELWIFGGLNYDPRRPKNEQFQHLLDVLKWDTTNEQESFKPTEIKLPQQRRAAGSAVIGDRLYLVGGMRERFELVETCDVFNFATQSWETIPPPKQPRISGELVVLNDQLYFGCGSSPDGAGDIAPNTSVEKYNPKTREWSVVIDRLPITASKHVRMFSTGSSLLFECTHDEENNTMHLLMFRP